MPFALHKVPAALLDLLRMRTLGRAPDGFGETVIAVIDATNFYGSDQQVVANSASAPQAYPFSGSGTATFGGRLFAASGTVVVGAAAGTQIRMRLGYRPGPSFQMIWIANELVTAPVAGQTYTINALLPSPIVFGPGAGFQFQAESDAAGADHVFTRREFFENYAV